MQTENEVIVFSNELELIVRRANSEEEPDFWELISKEGERFFRSLSDAEEYVAARPFHRFNKNQVVEIVGRKFTNVTHSVKEEHLINVATDEVEKVVIIDGDGRLA